MSYSGMIYGCRVEFGNQNQWRMIESSRIPEAVNCHPWEDPVWYCPRCMRRHTARVHIDEENKAHIVTPRLYWCRRCSQKVLFFRYDESYFERLDWPQWHEYSDDYFEGQALSMAIGKYEYCDPMNYKSEWDPLKFYWQL